MQAPGRGASADRRRRHGPTQDRDWCHTEVCMRIVTATAATPMKSNQSFRVRKG